MTALPDPDGPAPRGGPGRPAVPAPVRAGPAPGLAVGAPGRRDVRGPLAAALAGLAAVTYLALSDPYRPGRHLVCPLLALTGLLCPACGSQRAVHSLAHGDLVGAWDMNPLLVVLAPVGVVVWGRWLVRRSGGADRPGAAGRSRLGRRARRAVAAVSPWALLTVVVAFGVLRNVPALQPWLAP
jgi:hypothetical protein